jgi:hypothetical protein
MPITKCAVKVISRSQRSMRTKRAGIDHLGNDLTDRARTNQPHVHRKLIPQDLKSTPDALLPIARKRVQVTRADADRQRAEGDGFEHVAHTPDVEYGEVGVRPRAFGLECGGDVDEVLDAGAARVELAAIVVAGIDERLEIMSEKNIREVWLAILC